jgi:hypothetical protein
MKEILTLPHHDPKQHEKNMKKLFTMQHSPNQPISPEQPTITTQSNERPKYAQAKVPPELEAIAKYGIYDTHLKDNENHPNGFIPGSIMEEIKNALTEHRENPKKPTVILIPFHQEDDTIAKNLNNAVEWVGRNRTFAISTGLDNSTSEERAHATGCEIQQQTKEFEDWNTQWSKLKKDFNISNDHNSEEPIKGSKGLTIRAGAMKVARWAVENEYYYQNETDKLIKNEEIEEVYVGYHDSDIYNPSEYYALPLMLLPYTEKNAENSQVYMSIIGRTGAGRNNEPIQNEVNYLANSEDEKLSRYGRTQQSTVWPLSGERVLPLSALLNMPMATGMGIETTINSYIAGQSATENNGHIANVLNPNHKIEDKPSSVTREFSVIFSCEDMFKAISKHIKETEKYPNEWTPKDIASYNSMYGGKIKYYTYPTGERTTGNVPGARQTDYLLPSINDTLALGISTLPENNKQPKIESSQKQIFPSATL